MAPDPLSSSCNYPNFFSSTLAPALQSRLPEEGTLAGRAIDHLTNVGPFLQNVSQDLCDFGRMGQQSERSALGFLARSTTSAAVASGSLGLAALGLAFGSPLLALGAGAVGLVALPPLAERAAIGVVGFARGLLDDLRDGIQGASE
jgi:hypothetical protein